MHNEVKLRASGEISIYKVVNGVQHLKCTKHNTVQSDATKILVMRVAENVDSKIDKIDVYDGVTLKASGTILTTVGAYGIAPSNFICSAVFDGASFSGNFDKVVLRCEGLVLVFSEVTGLAETKDPGEIIVIKWKITIEI